MNHSDDRHQPIPPFAPQGPGAYTSGGAPAPLPPPAPARRSWFARHKILTGMLAVVVLGVGAAAVGGGGDEPTPAATPAADAPAAAPEETAEDEAPEAAPVDLPKIGDAVRDGKFEFTVTAVETGVAAVGNDLFGEEAQGQFVLVHMTVANIGDEAQMLSGSNQTLVDDQGRQHSANSSAAIYLDDADTFLNDINPGNSVEGVVVFDVPADAVPAAIELHDSVFSGGVTVSLEQ
ncbi:DUF4352 domain-containing protein [Georgenia wutianyii]|nr:DUF4352 domain-containing protein [Georgenia wutianyii]